MPTLTPITFRDTLALVWISLGGSLLVLLAQLVVVRPLPSAKPPPLMRIHYQPVRPSARHVWINAHWAPVGDAFEWRQGRWSVPPRDELVWEPHKWDDRGGRWIFLPGHFRSKRKFDASTPVPPLESPPAPIPTPAPLVEQHEGPPHPLAVWRDGQWWWDGAGFLWIAGRWSAPQ